MTGTNHGMTGAVIALLVKEPLLAIPLSFASHFACDAIPHYTDKRTELFGKKFNYLLVGDFLFSLLLMVFLGVLFPAEKWVIWACMIAAASPDLMWAYYHLYVEKINHKKPGFGPIARFHSRIQWSATPAGAFVELTWFIVMSSIILTQR